MEIKKYNDFCNTEDLNEELYSLDYVDSVLEDMWKDIRVDEFLGRFKRKYARELNQFKQSEQNFLNQKKKLDDEKKRVSKTHNLGVLKRVKHQILKWKVKFNTFTYHYYEKKGDQIKSEEWKTHMDRAVEELNRFRRVNGVKMKKMDY